MLVCACDTSARPNGITERVIDGADARQLKAAFLHLLTLTQQRQQQQNLMLKDSALDGSLAIDLEAGHCGRFGAEAEVALQGSSATARDNRLHPPQKGRVAFRSAKSPKGSMRPSNRGLAGSVDMRW